MQVGFIHDSAGNSEEVNVSSNVFYFKEEGSTLIISENGGSIRAEVDQDCIILKLIQKLSLVTLQGAQLQEGSTYFMEVGEKLIYKTSTYELKSLDHNEQAPIEIEKSEAPRPMPQPKIEEQDTPELEIVIQDEEDDDDISFEVDSSNNTSPIQKNDNNDTLSITQVLRIAKEEKTSEEVDSSDEHVSRPLSKSKKKVAKKAKKKTKSSSQPQLTTARDYKGNIAKRDASKKVKQLRISKKDKQLSAENLVGPFTRFLSAVSLIFATVLVSAQLEVKALNDLAMKLTELLNTEIAKHLEFSLNMEITKVFILLLVILTISNLLLSVSPTLFISGATTEGNFFVKRAKAFLRTPLDFIAHFIPIFEISVIFDTPSLKEKITMANIKYRIRGFKYIPLFMLTIFTALVIGYPIINEGLVNSNPPTKINIPKDLGKRPLKFKELILSKKFSQDNIIFRIPSVQPSYFILNKQTAKTMILRANNTDFFKTYQATFETIPFFKYRYPYLSSFFKDEKSSFLVREDFAKIFWGGEIIKGQAAQDLMYLDILAISQSKKIFNRFKFPYSQYRNLNKFTSLYRSKSQDVYLYIADDSVIQFIQDGGSLGANDLGGLSFLARPKVRIEYIDSVEKAYLGKNNSLLLLQLKEANDIIAAKNNGENQATFKKFAQNMAKFLQGSTNSVGQATAKEILTLSTLNN